MTSSFRPDCLRGKVAFITGGGSGIGMGITKVLMEHGCDTFIASRNIERLKLAARELESAAPGRRCRFAGMDVRNEKSVEAAVEAAIKDFGRIDILVNSAAGNFMTPLDKLSIRGFRTVMEIDTMGCFTVSKVVKDRAFSQQHVVDGQRGVIINISVTLHYVACLMQTHVGAAKAAIDALTQHMAVEWGPQGIRVVGIAPGPIAGTEGLERLMPKQENGEPMRIEDFVPLQRLGYKRDIGLACLFLSLPDASYVTGTTLVVDGGQWMTSGNFPILEARLRNRWLQGGSKL